MNKKIKSKWIEDLAALVIVLILISLTTLLMMAVYNNYVLGVPTPAREYTIQEENMIKSKEEYKQREEHCDIITDNYQEWAVCMRSLNKERRE